MTTKLYMCILGGVSGGFVLCVLLIASMRHFAQLNPSVPAGLPAGSVWRPTPAEAVALRPHGDWIKCWNEGAHDRCLLTDATGSPEYEGLFSSLPNGGTVEDARLRPVTSDTISPWMWSAHLHRQVPMIHLEDGTVLAPTESVADLRGYVERVTRFNPRVNPSPLYAEYYHPAGTK